MSLKVIWNFLKSKFFWINIAAAIVVGCVIVTVVLLSLKKFTLHGEEIEVPDLRGLYTEEAAIALKRSGLTYEVIDSVYMRDRLAGEIVEQVPAAGGKVKLGRKIYLTINAKAEKQVTVPDLTNFPMRQAKATLEASGFRVEKIEYRPSEYPGLVMDVKAGGRSVAAGERLRDGSSLVLVVGERTMGETAYTPDVKGMTAAEAEACITQNRFVLGAVEYDETPTDEADKQEFFVYRQSPQATSAYATGHRIDIWLSKDTHKSPQKTNQNTMDENFFE